MNTFTGKVVWITGASSGIGEAIALGVAQAGARLVLSSRRVDELQRVATQTGLPDADVFILPLDMTNRAGFTGQVEQIRQCFGRIDYLFLNAGITQRGLVADTDFSVYERLMDVNFLGVVALTQAVLPLMLTQKSGHFVVTSSVAGKLGTKERSGYCASKHALHGFFDALRAETHSAGLRVTIVCPGYIKTAISLHALNASGQPHGRMDTNQEKGMEPTEFVRRLLRAVIRKREEIYIGGIETYGIYLKRLFPILLSRIVRVRKSN